MQTQEPDKRMETGFYKILRSDLTVFPESHYIFEMLESKNEINSETREVGKLGTFGHQNQTFYKNSLAMKIVIHKPLVGNIV